MKLVRTLHRLPALILGATLLGLAALFIGIPMLTSAQNPVSLFLPLAPKRFPVILASPTPTATVAPPPTASPTPTSTPAPVWSTILQENFEGSFPGVWKLADTEPGFGEILWGKRSCRVYAGSYSGWAVGGGANGSPLSCGSLYPTYVNSWMIYGPFSMADAVDGDLTFKVWLNTEEGLDNLLYGASFNGIDYAGVSLSGQSNGWIERTLDLSTLPIGSAAGKAQVWIAFQFYSDGIITLNEGAYLDNIVLRKATAASMTLDNPGISENPSGLRQSPAYFTLQGNGAP